MLPQYSLTGRNSLSSIHWIPITLYMEWKLAVAGDLQATFCEKNSKSATSCFCYCPHPAQNQTHGAPKLFSNSVWMWLSQQWVMSPSYPPCIMHGGQRFTCLDLRSRRATLASPSSRTKSSLSVENVLLPAENNTFDPACLCVRGAALFICYIMQEKSS